jgi:hypothetical protein
MFRYLYHSRKSKQGHPYTIPYQKLYKALYFNTFLQDSKSIPVLRHENMVLYFGGGKEKTLIQYLKYRKKVQD